MLKYPLVLFNNLEHFGAFQSILEHSGVNFNILENSLTFFYISKYPKRFSQDYVWTFWYSQQLQPMIPNYFCSCNALFQSPYFQTEYFQFENGSLFSDNLLCDVYVAAREGFEVIALRPKKILLDLLHILIKYVCLTF